MNNPQGKPDILRLFKADGITIFNPATEEKQDDIITAVNAIAGAGSAITAGRKVIAVNETPIVLGGNVTTTVIFINALSTNKKPIVVGDNSVVYDPATRTGAILYPASGMTININNLNLVFINGLIGEGVSFSYLA